jgi:GAF domain-containing protein
MCWLGYAENDETKTICPFAQAGHEEGYISSFHVSWDKDNLAEYGPMGRAFQERRLVVIGDTTTDTSFLPWREAATQRGYFSTASLPIYNKDDIIGVLAIYSGEIGIFNSEESRLLGELAMDISQ